MDGKYKTSVISLGVFPQTSFYTFFRRGDRARLLFIQFMAPHIEPDATPGTVKLLDLQHAMHTRHLDKGDHEIVLIPTPSNDPDDPLNWSPRRKLLSTVSVNM